MPTIDLNYLFKRDGHWYYRRRVPLHLRHLDPRKEIKIALKVSVLADPDGTKRAARLAMLMDAEIEQDWADLVDGRNPNLRRRTIRAIDRAKVLNIPYRTAADIAGGDLSTILKRTEVMGREIAAIESRPMPTKPTAAEFANYDATLGGTAKSGILVSGLFEAYYAIVAVDHRQKRERQLATWKNRKRAACTNFIAVVADMDILDIERHHATTFCDWWAKRMIDENLDAYSAIKDLGNMRSMIAAVCKRHNLTDPKMFAGLSFKAKKKARRNARGGNGRAFKAQWVLENIWPDGSLPKLNREAYDLMIVLIETGARPTEVCGLNKNTIHLKGTNIPYITIVPDEQELKTANSERDIPLVGRALEVMRRYPNGFLRYYLKPENYCEAVNTHLTPLQTDLPEGQRAKTIYGVRHLFKDRLRAARVEDEMKNALMGHDHDDDDSGAETEVYGDGFELQAKLDTLQKIAFPWPL